MKKLNIVKNTVFVLDLNVLWIQQSETLESSSFQKIFRPFKLGSNWIKLNPDVRDAESLANRNHLLWAGVAILNEILDFVIILRKTDSSRPILLLKSSTSLPFPKNTIGTKLADSAFLWHKLILCFLGFLTSFYYFYLLKKSEYNWILLITALSLKLLLNQNKSYILYKKQLNYIKNYRI